MSSRRRAFRLVVAGISLVAVMFLFVLPARTYLAQRRSLSEASDRVQVLSQENAKLAQQVQLLQTDAEIERLARQQYGLVKPGETAYAILPPKAPATTVPARAQSRRSHPGVFGRLWRDLQVWH
jgi:cell division protein FtsB